ncbi:hypothetical protein Q7P37_007937 [Cladosporium fusiforme]
MIYLRFHTAPSCSGLPRLQRASAPGDLRLEIACVASADPALRALHGHPSLLHVSIPVLLLPDDLQRCTPAHHTGVWADGPRVEPSGPLTAVRSITVVGKDASRPIPLELAIPGALSPVTLRVFLHATHVVPQLSHHYKANYILPAHCPTVVQRSHSPVPVPLKAHRCFSPADGNYLHAFLTTPPIANAFDSSHHVLFHVLVDAFPAQATTNSPTAGLCERRQWSSPLYEPYQTRLGYFCKVRVNNREYSTDVPYKTAALARDGAATKAFMICRNFSANDGMYPGQRPGSGGVVQGLPVAIGEGRASRSCRSSMTGSEVSASEGSGGSSGGESPRSFESGYPEGQVGALPRPVSMVGAPAPPPGGRQNRRGGRGYHRGPAVVAAVPPPTMMGSEYVCLCRRGAVRAYGRCDWCLNECGWNAYIS